MQLSLHTQLCCLCHLAIFCRLATDLSVNAAAVVAGNPPTILTVNVATAVSGKLETDPTVNAATAVLLQQTYNQPCRPNAVFV